MGKTRPMPGTRGRAAPIDEGTCRNCGTVLVGDYCHACGQSADEPRRAVVGLVQDVFVDTLAIDGKLARTLWLLLTRPGRLARRYLDGKRVRYSPPFRLYLFASVLFFFVAFWMADIGRMVGNVNVTDDEAKAAEAVASGALPAEVDKAVAEAMAAKQAAVARGSVATGGMQVRIDRDAGARNDADQGAGDPPGDTDVASPPSDDTPADAGSHDAEQHARDIGKDESEGKPDRPFRELSWDDDLDYNGPDWFEPYLKAMFEAAQRAADDPRLFIAQARENVPRTMLLAPILYGLILLLLYAYRRSYLVYDHLVVSLYMHAALYAHLVLLLLLVQLPGPIRWIAFVPFGWALIQPYAVLRQAYGSNWVSVIVKGALSTTLYMVIFFLLITLGVSFALYQA